MRILLHTYEATKTRKTGLENHAVQLINTLQQQYPLEAIIQTNRRVSMYERDWFKKLFFYNLIEQFFSHIKIVVPLLNSLFYGSTHQLFTVIDTDTVLNKDRLLRAPYKKFKKLHISPHFYDMIKFRYWFTGRKNLIEIPCIDGVDIFWLTSPFPMYMKNKINICCVHDVFFKSTKPMTRMCTNNTQIKLKQIIEKFDLIFTVSLYTKNEIIKMFPTIDTNKIQVSYQSIPEKNFLFPLVNQRINLLKKHRLQSKKFLLHVGSLIPRKNQINLIKAFLKCNLDMPLVMIGKKTKYMDNKLMKLIKMNSPHVMWLNNLKDIELNVLYQEATALLFPSLYEGFGLPILEAFHHGCPVVTSNTSAIPEIAGDAVVYVNPDDVDDICSGIQLIVSDKELQEKLIAAGTAQLANFNVANILKKTNHALSELTQFTSSSENLHA